MSSEKFRITTNGQSLRNPTNAFYGMTLTANMTLDESDVSALNDRRSAHNALERQRREHLNVKFQQLAHALPSLQTVRRPSKTMIVAKSLEFVSSSLKRESNYTSQIQKLRLENEKLRKQAEASSRQLKKQRPQEDLGDGDNETKIEEPKEEETTSLCSTVLPEKTCLKRKASSQLSPPPTPDAMRDDKPKVANAADAVVVVAATQPPKKQRMVKQTKPFTPQVPVQQPFDFSPSLESSSWSPVGHTPPTYFDVTSASPTYTNVTSPLPMLTTSGASDLYPHQILATQPQQFQNMIYPMLFAPYNMPPEVAASPNDFSFTFINSNNPHPRQQSDGSHGDYFF